MISPRDNSARRTTIWAALALLLFCIGALFSGCNLARHTARGGGVAATIPGMSASASAPDSPATPTSQAVSRRIVREYAPPPLPYPNQAPFAPAMGATTQAAPDSPPASPTVPARADLIKETITEEARAESGAAQVDQGAKVAASIGAMAQVQYFGAACALGALALFHPAARLAVGGGKQMQMAAGIAAAACLFGPQIVAGHEGLLIVCACVFLAAIWGLSRLSYKEGQSDILTLNTTK